MRPKALAVLTALAAFAAGRSHALPAKDVFLLENAVPLTAGTVGAGQTHAYRIHVSDAQKLKFAVSGDSACGLEITKTSQLGVLASMARFPGDFRDDAKAGEAYTLSFFQNRTAWIDKTVCEYSFSVNP